MIEFICIVAWISGIILADSWFSKIMALIIPLWAYLVLLNLVFDHNFLVYPPDKPREWRVNGRLHREDGPARIWADGGQEWWINGILHREDGPAIIYPNGNKEWYVNGNRHRVDGPAITKINGYQVWYINGKAHREDGPAVIKPDGCQAWYRDDKLHREDGPAIIHADGTREWWINNVCISQEVEDWIETQNITWPWDDDTQTQFQLTF